MVPQTDLTAMREYAGADYLEGPLVIIEGASDAAYNEVVEVIAPDGATRLGQVLDVSEERAVVELWGDTAGLHPPDLRVRLRGHPLQVPVAREMLGRVFDGLGRPLDGLPAPIAEDRVYAHGSPLNPAARAYPHAYIQTGISTIDGLNTLVRGQKLPIFSGGGLPHNELAAQIARQAQTGEDQQKFAIVFVALGVPHETARNFQRSLTESGALNQAALFLNLADDPPVERTITPRVALSLAEFLAFQHEMQVLVIMTDITNYGEALRELSTRREEVPTRKGYPSYMYSDLASLFERCGRVRDRAGSITQMPVLTMPNDDITHPIPDLTGYITEGQIVLSRELYQKGIYPPISVLPSLSRLMDDGIGEGQTRADHPDLADQLYAAYARVQNVRNLADIIGEADLSSTDRDYMEFGDDFERRFVAQRHDEARTIIETLDLGWEALGRLPREELTRVSEEQIEEYYHRG
jgi:V/A-type H+-transporting ATPase subunit B